MRTRSLWLVGLAWMLAGCLTVPLAADRPETAEFSPTPARSVDLTVIPLRVGSTSAPRCAAAGQATCMASMDIVHVAYLVKHPKATFLIDSSLSTKHRGDVARFGFVDRLLLDYKPEGNLKDRLAEVGESKVDFVVITHAHWDHTSGLVDMSRPRVVMGPGEAEFVRAYPSNKSPTVMPDHLDAASLETFAWDGPRYENFPSSHDWFNDGSVVLVPLPGHTPGSIGIFLNTVRGRRLLFVGDAAWSLDAIELPSHKLKPMCELTDNDPVRLSETLWRLHHLHARSPQLLIVPTHDGRAYEAVRELVGGHP
jgi:N-acyl homoserine lactone hydrolase